MAVLILVFAGAVVWLEVAAMKRMGRAALLEAQARVEPPSDPADSIKDVVVAFGDGGTKAWHNGAFPVGPDPVTASEWMIVPNASGICTTRVSVTTYKGITADTSIRTRVLDTAQAHAGHL